YEQGPRMLLNLGHSIGHGVEVISGLAHGAAVAVGLIAAFGLVSRRARSGGDSAAGTSIERTAERVRAVLKALSLPLTLEDARLTASAATSPAAFREAVIEAMTADKKRRGADMLFALPRGIGNVTIEPVGLEELAGYVREAP
ncbi:MAG TPA: hypothetical protein DCG47_10120, partial [Spirochaetaceae bacterium]|nr:hypothetical protein [Spirochaetaceae bacterium]